MSFRVLGIDPGLTRCGVGVVDVRPDRRAALVEVTVIRTPPSMPLEERLLAVGDGIERLLDEHRPAAVAIERVFAQHNLRTVMGIAQVSGVALHSAAKRSLPVALHTPSEVKAAITGYGSADKKQVQAMVARILGLAEAPKPADAADALAIAICHAWRGAPAAAASASGGGAAQTPAQAAWLAAERSARASAAPRRLAR
ncbi:crossover junction endodeoxyribonuclease RuvC [Leifsonia sp. LS1]|uniref:crossover junction endodeoxyribonuclease RuvC n=1 Tax=unclassified Leifsonia TaxID=2663824 RepID=UPI001CBC7E1E|nr:MULTISPECIES: crossover junction endodeoxyribonuclease RuvC [unclassified Leifsonia]UAJ77971.1 crossover junction endodeoxyribonuclease RuvC [Leifsonia sp. ZF2019]GIT80279.1 crossover junction endodeoxyribonuclease RuvC [Leifsonia sp. LS1]